MKSFFAELHRRNPLLSIFGWLCIAGGIICAIMTQMSDTIVLGINAYIKPMKFFFSICIFSWTMAWYLSYLQMPRRAKAYSVMVVIVFIIEIVIIVWQATNGRLSHFNIETPLYGMLFSLMGIAIMVLWIWTVIITIYFFKKKNFDVSMTFIWGIRLGLVLFLIFSIEGGMMSSRLSHTVGAADGGDGLPIVNWSKEYGDLRVAHFIGMHALQIIPLFSHYVARKPGNVALFSSAYFILAMALFLQAMYRMPLFF
ncbi:MAG TPA: hypothetical protein VEV87_01770 [Chitinophagaceae bacterium]|nr:hypothetical protein [Chitinophagaceae bacterium]